MSANTVILKKGDDVIYPQTLASCVFTEDGTSIEDLVNGLVADSYYYQGVAIPTTNPGTFEGKAFYFASVAGTYTYFGNLSVPQGVSILQYNGTGWTVTTLTSIVNDLTTGGYANALSAEQGKVLKAFFDAGFQYKGFLAPGSYVPPSINSFYLASAAGVYEFTRSNGTTVSYTLVNNTILYVFSWNPAVTGEWVQAEVFRSGYVAPVGGIPASDLATDVQNALGLAVSSYQKPSSGIPKLDFSQSVQDTLDLADSAVQARTVGGITPPVDPGNYVTTQSIVNNLSDGGTAVPLSAQQGKVLNQIKVEAEVISDAVPIPSSVYSND